MARKSVVYSETEVNYAKSLSLVIREGSKSASELKKREKILKPSKGEYEKIVLFKNGKNKTYSSIEKLKTQGEVVREKIKEIRNLLK